MISISEMKLNLTVGFVDIRHPEGELIKETFDIDNYDLPCIKFVKDGRHYHQPYFQTSFSVKAYTDFIDAVETGNSVNLNEAIRPRVT